LVAGSNGLFYGSTYTGGTNGTGTLFSVKTDGTFQSLFSFSSVNKYSKNQQGAHPVNLLVYSNGYLYGTAATAGQTSFGTVFSLKVQ